MQIISYIIIVAAGRLEKFSWKATHANPTRKKKRREGKAHKFPFAPIKSSLEFICLVSRLSHIIHQRRKIFHGKLMLFCLFSFSEEENEEENYQRRKKIFPDISDPSYQLSFLFAFNIHAAENASQTELFWLFLIAVCAFCVCFERKSVLFSIYFRLQIKQINCEPESNVHT